MSDQSQAQTQANVDEAKLRAEYWEAVKREAEARKAIADAEASVGTAEDAARAALTKAQADADKARLDYLKGQLPTAPDPSKYKLASPTAPNVAATASRMTFGETSALAERVATALIANLKPAPNNGADDEPKITVLPDDVRARTLIGLSRALRETLDQATERLKDEGEALDATGARRPISEVAPILGPALSALGEVVLSYATILRTQYAFATASQVPLAEAVLRSKVQQKLAEQNIQVIEPDSIIVVTPASGTTPPELAKLQDLQGTIADVRSKIRAASGKVEELRRTAAGQKDDEKKATLKLADEIEARAKQVVGAIEEVNKMLATLYVADAQGNTPLDAALRGGRLSDRLAASSAAYLLALKAAASDVDTIAANRFFSGLHVAVASNTVVHWRLTTLDGIVHASGAEQKDTSLTKVKLP